MSSGPESLPPNAIAITGIAGRFPGADSVSAFWRNLRRGEESIVTLAEDELIAAGVPDTALANPAYVRRAALLDGVAEFDAEFFGFTPQAARMMDPQHRLFLQCAWHALEDAGCDPAQFDGSIGVYGTSSASGYLLHNLMSHHDPNRIIGQGATFDMINLSMQNDKDYLATRVSHQFDLRGPALSVQTACSSSLVAVHLACQSISSGESDMALAGAASIRVPHRVGYWHDPGSMVSRSGHCRPFDVRADGTVFGSGVAVVVLKPLTRALEDGDRIHAVIRGSAINNDGSTKMTYAAPNAVGQAEVIAEAHAVADVDASTISYVETHGTGTPLGDPIEIEGLRQAFDLSTATRPGPCVIGSVKSNIGHLEVASGIAGLMKTILCLEHKALPGTLHYTSPNPELRLDRGMFVVRSEHSAWECGGVRRAGVSSFGVGGTNAHIVLEEAPPVPAPAVQNGPRVLLLSARTAESLQQFRSAIHAELSDADTELNLPDVAFTLANRRAADIRLAAVVKDQQDAAAVLAADEHDNVFIGEAPHHEPGSSSVAFIFPGQGAQHVGMAQGLYETEPVFAEHFDRCAAGFAEEMGIDLRGMVFDAAGRDLDRTDHAQPALFAVEYALALLVESYGVRPTALAGHSIGEYVAATVAGVFDLPMAIKAVSVRAQLMQAAPRGVMVAVPLSPEAATEHLTDAVDLATVNDPHSCVVAGSDEDIGEFSRRLARHGIVTRRVRTSHAFHSRLMEPVIDEFRGFLSRMTLCEPRIPLLSNVTGTWMSAADATSPANWARQIRTTVRFSDELDALLADPARVVVEVGPGGSLTGSAIRHPKWSNEHRAVRLMRHHAQNRNDHDTFLLGLGQLWSAGIEVDWTAGLGDSQPHRISLPGYPFERQRHWVDHKASVDGTAGTPVTNRAMMTRSGGSEPNTRTTNDGSQIEAVLQEIWSRCLGVDSINRNSNFFEVGGDSLIAISVAMNAANDGLDITPQDLYENQTVAALAESLAARYAAGLARQSTTDVLHPPAPPNISYFLEHGLREAGRWRVPLILRLRPDIQAEDVRAVLTAVTNHHDALRLRITQRAGTSEQHVADPQHFSELTTHSLAAGLTAGSVEERDAVLGILMDQIRTEDLCSAPLRAMFIRGVAGAPCCLAMSLHGMVNDNVSRDILFADIFTAFDQLLSGKIIALPPVTTPWREWSQRCAGLATHPAVVGSRDYWLNNSAKATLHIADSASCQPEVDDLARLSTTLTWSQTTEIDAARRELRVPIDAILLSALGRVIAAAVGDGSITVDLEGQGRSVLKPDVGVHRTIGWFTTIYPIDLPCRNSQDVTASEILDKVHDTLKAVPHYGIGYGLLRYMYAPTARMLGGIGRSDILFSYVGTIPELPHVSSTDAPVQFDGDTAMPVREAIPGLGHAIELRVYRFAGALHLDWWYDTRRVEPAMTQSLADGLPIALTELVQEAFAGTEFETGSVGLALVDLSSATSGIGERDGSTP
ncbi:type I polyketide synthase [Mycobacterium sp. JS623]|uniref:type I polyketide synthase n=1 Tax=Mycobacterium sp. JS623 TaxID=212767 RepID=UPI00059D6D24|nr:type I polyketide synthase [Mycobacterium sp. JS623]